MNPWEEDLEDVQSKAIAERKHKQDVINDLNAPWDMSEQGLARKEQELSRREEDLQRREQQLLDKEKKMPKPRVNNWPRCKPFLYQNIDEDMPTPEVKSLVRKAYYGWFALVGCMLYNVVSVLAALIAITDSTGPYIAAFFMALATLIFSFPTSFLIFRLLYNAGRKSKPSLYILYFIFLWIELLVFAFMAVGYVGWGGGGFLVMLDGFEKGYIAVGVISLVCMLLWLGLIGFYLYLFIKARIEYRSAGGLSKAKTEAEEVGKTFSDTKDIHATV